LVLASIGTFSQSLLSFCRSCMVLFLPTFINLNDCHDCYPIYCCHEHFHWIKMPKMRSQDLSSWQPPCASYSMWSWTKLWENSDFDTNIPVLIDRRDPDKISPCQISSKSKLFEAPKMKLQMI
jgi:hypothetical protein